MLSPAPAVPVAASENPSVPTRDAAVEGLRGLAAGVVFCGHVLAGAVGGWMLPSTASWLFPGPAAVLVFFVLSGFVIGTRYRAAPSTADLRAYFGRRLLRLFPINLAGVLLACAVAESVDWPTVLGNIFFFESYCDYVGRWVLVLPQNQNLWSLNYEILFYTLFALLWWRHVPLRWSFAATLALGLLGWFRFGVPVCVACYAFGFLFWLGGLALAWESRPTSDAHANWPTCVLLLLVTWKLQGLAELMISLAPGAPRFAGPVVKLYYLELLPTCLWLLAAVARRTFPGFGFVRAVAGLIPLLGFALRVRGSEPAFAGETALLVASYLAALALWRWRPSTAIFRRFAWLGLISYALYATARPIQLGVYRLGEKLPPGVASFLLCAVATTVLALGVAWYLERRLQPALARAFRR